MRGFRPKLLRLVGKIPYDSGSYILSSVHRSKTLRRLFYRQRESVVRRFLDDIGSTVNADEALCQSVVSGKFVAWRLAAISRAHHEVASKWIHINGVNHIEDSYRINQRLIVISCHFGMPRVVPQLLSHMGYQIQSIIRESFYKHFDLPELKNLSQQQLGESQFFAKDIFVALKALKAGKIFLTMADGLHGKAFVDFPLLGRTRGFPKSYAELALSSGAQVIPVFTRIELSGQIYVKFCPPLDKGEASMAQEDRVSLMVQQYVSLLADEYMSHPGCVHLNHMTNFLDRPLATNDADSVSNSA